MSPNMTIFQPDLKFLKSLSSDWLAVRFGQTFWQRMAENSVRLVSDNALVRSITMADVFVAKNINKYSNKPAKGY